MSEDSHCEAAVKGRLGLELNLADGCDAAGRRGLMENEVGGGGRASSGSGRRAP